MKKLIYLIVFILSTFFLSPIRGVGAFGEACEGSGGICFNTCSVTAPQSDCMSGFVCCPLSTWGPCEGDYECTDGPLCTGSRPSTDCFWPSFCCPVTSPPDCTSLGGQCYDYTCPTGTNGLAGTCPVSDSPQVCCTTSTIQTCSEQGGICTRGICANPIISSDCPEIEGGNCCPVSELNTCAGQDATCSFLLCPNPSLASSDCEFPNYCCPSYASPTPAPACECDDSGNIVYDSCATLGPLRAFCVWDFDDWLCTCVSAVVDSPATCNPGGSTVGIDTAIGCIPVSITQGFVNFLLGWAIGIAGGIAFVLIIYGGFLVITSVGNPQKVQAGKELITAAVSGLLLLVFGAFILEFIGVDILNIPGFGR